MTKSGTCVAWDLTASVVLFIPIIVIFLIPLMIGIGLDVIALVGEVPLALALCAPLAFVVLRIFPRRALTRHLAALLRPRLSPRLNYAARQLTYRPGRILVPRTLR
jgi:hypothetical protein